MSRRRFHLATSISCPVDGVHLFPQDLASDSLRRLSKLQERAALPDLILKWRDEEPVTVRRQVYLAADQRTPLEEGAVPIELEQDGLRADGLRASHALRIKTLGLRP